LKGQERVIENKGDNPKGPENMYVSQIAKKEAGMGLLSDCLHRGNLVLGG